MNQRQGQLLKHIVEEYITTASPVGSPVIAEKYFPDLSSATIRNEMAEIEESGYISQPYTSAGRVPTVEGLRYYVDNFLQDNESRQTDRDLLKEFNQPLERDSAKHLARLASELINEAVVVSFGPNDVYCTGIANLFSQPEFSQAELLQSMSEVIDGLDLIVGEVFSEIGDEPKIYVGEEDSFGTEASAVIIKVPIGAVDCLFGILGPNRMDYSRNLSLIKLVQELTNTINNQ
jgi:transcriptional regulator of heat shock response